MSFRASKAPIGCRIAPSTALAERVIASGLRRSLRLSVKPFLRPSCPLGVQRGLVHVLSCLMQPERCVRVRKTTIQGPVGAIPVERIVPRDLAQPRHAVLYLHGGGFYLGSPRSFRSITTRLAHLAQAEVLAPHYRRAPEHIFPAQLEDALASYEHLIADGYEPEHLAVGGDSAGGLLCLQLLLALRGRHQPLPGAVAMISPLADPTFAGSGSLIERAGRVGQADRRLAQPAA
jgi:acetyl esterase/lipase